MSFANPTAGSISWLARHEFNLSWRDFTRMMTAGRPGRAKSVIGWILASVVIIHLIAYLVLGPYLQAGFVPDKTILTLVTGTILLMASLMVSQGMELVTRVFYSRSDLDLILSSPVSVRKLFTVRIGAITVSTTLLSLLLCGAAINILAFFNSLWWLSAYLVVIGCGMLATVVALAITITLFDTIGARATRLAAQIIAAIVGAGFVIGIQLAAISSIGNMSRFEFIASSEIVAAMPEAGSWLWIPARAATGDLWSLLAFSASCLGLLVFAVVHYSRNFAERVVLAAGISQTKSGSARSNVAFRSMSTAAVLRRKEWKLLARDHWLVSQSLMQVLYLVPPAYMLWHSFGTAGAVSVVAVPVLVMASGQLAGGLAWLAISGEDAPQLVETAPVPKGAVLRAKIEAVLGAIAIVVLPIIALIAIIDPYTATVALIGIAIASASATMIQLWFRSQAKRSSFRRRQTSSKVATLAEAFSSIIWAGCTGLAASGGLLFAAIFSIFGILVLWIARSFRPSQEN